METEVVEPTVSCTQIRQQFFIDGYTCGKTVRIGILEEEEAAQQMADGSEHEAFGQELAHDASLRSTKTPHDADILFTFACLEPESANGAETEVDHKEDGERDLAAI